MSTPTVALCMIVRDEEIQLPGALESVRGLCAEMIVVDTGSTDGTVAIATRAGARVVRFAWCDDFAAARNAGIREATSDWVLVLDADERLAPGGAEVVRRKLAHVDSDCGMLKLHDAARLESTAEEVLSGRERLGDPMYVPRLLRRTDDLAFDGIVHESVRAWLLRHGNRVWDVGTDILHYGAVASLRTARGKASRNTLLLEKRLSLEPDDFTVHGYLAHEYVAAAEPEKARAIVDQGWELMKRASPNTLRSALRLLAARALIQLQEGDADAALASVNDAIAYEGEGPDALFFRGRAYELKAQTSEGAVQEAMLTLAERAYRGCFAWADRVVAQRFVRGASSWCGRTRLATVRLLRGDAAEALELFLASHAETPATGEAELGICEALIELGRASEALSRLEEKLGDARAPDAWLLAAQAAEELGRLEDMKRFLAKARETSSVGYLASHRNQVHGRMHCALVAYLGQPQPGHAALGAATAIIGGHRATATITPIERRTLVRLVRNLLALGHSSFVERLLEPAAQAMLPGIGELVTEVVTSLGMTLKPRSHQGRGPSSRPRT